MNGRILTLVRQNTDQDFGGDLVIIDTKTYVENSQPMLASAGMAGPAQTRATQNDVRRSRAPRPAVASTQASRCWDGTNRILTSWSQCRLLDNTTNAATTIVPCTDSRLSDPTAVLAPPHLQRVDVRSRAEHAAAGDHADGRRDDHRRGGRAAAPAAAGDPRSGDRAGQRQDAHARQAKAWACCRSRASTTSTAWTLRPEPRRRA